jgi:predicted dehydrogenase
MVASRRSPLVIDYRLNAGYIPGDHWVQTAEGGGRNIGEACHMYDAFRALTGAPPTGVTAQTIDPGGTAYFRNDNFAATVTYADGSLASLTYTALGPKNLPKERIEIFCDGDAYIINDFKQLTRATARCCGRAATSTRATPPRSPPLPRRCARHSRPSLSTSSWRRRRRPSTSKT